MPTSFTSSCCSTPSFSSSIFSPNPHSFHPMDHSVVDQLHFDVPLISTKRLSNSNESDHYDAYATDTSRRVPFLWERAPGVPKEDLVAVGRERKNSASEEEFFTPRLPPGRLRLPSVNGRNRNRNGNRNKEDEFDVDDDYNNDSPNTTMFSDALDKLSLSDSAVRVHVPKDAAGPRVTRAPSFIMNRFLPAANALATSSTPPSLPQYSNRISTSGTREVTKIRTKKCSGENIMQFQVGYHDYGTNSYGDHIINVPPASSPSKACGIMLLFPWGMKRAVACGLKSPVRRQMTPKMTTSIEEFTRRNNSNKGPGDDGRLEYSDDGVSSRAWKSPGWGLPFLDTSRLRWKGKGKVRECSRRMSSGSECGKPLPKLKSPSEPWLAHALNSVKRRKYS